MSLKSNITGGILWTTIETIVNVMMGLVIKFLLARWLFPEAYGLVSMAIVIIAFIEIFNELGLKAALIQMKESRYDSMVKDTAFWTSTVWGVLLFIVVSFIGAPFAAHFYDEKQLYLIIPVLALTILLKPFALVYQAQLSRDLNFKKLAIINNIGNIVAGIIALALAYLGFGVWALVFNIVAETAIIVPLFMVTSEWQPKLRWKKEKFRQIAGFGIYAAGAGFFTYLILNVDYLAIGKLVGVAALGVYSLAFILTNGIRNYITSIVNKVLYPVYMRLQDNRQQMLTLYYKVIGLNLFITIPVLVGVFLFVEFFIPLILGTQWIAAIPVIKVLSIQVLILMLRNGHPLLFRAAGEVRLEFRLQMAKALLFFVPMVLLGVYFYDLMGGAWGLLVATICDLLLSFYFMIKKFGLSLKYFFSAIKMPFWLSVFGIFSVELLKNVLDWRLCLLYYVIEIVIGYYFFDKNHWKLILGMIKKEK